jgi:bacterioferritin (cytochrome b1)
MAKKELIEMLNKALQLEHAARIQYLSHAEVINGVNAEPVIARLKELAGDEKGHEDTFRDMISAYLGGVPTMGIGETKAAGTMEDILEVNLAAEKHAVDFYMEVYTKIVEMKDELKYEFYQLEHSMRHVIQDEQEHISEIKLLLGQ